MKIGIDARLCGQTGVGRYTRNLVSNLLKLDKKNEYTLFVLSQDEKEFKIQNSKFKIVRTDIPWHGIREQIELPRILNEQNLDLVHFPYFSVPFIYNKPYIITVHDLIINKFNTGKASTLPYPLYFAKRVGYGVVLSNAVSKAIKIIVPSNAVKDDLLGTYKNIGLNKVKVTYEGGFDSGSKIKDQRLKIKVVEGRYLLRVGNFYPHKNVEGLLYAFRAFVYDTENRDAKLVLVGKKDYFYKRIEQKIKELNIEENIIFSENPSDAMLISLYQNAKATIIPSFMEGFSLTAIEAMTCSCPVIVSDIPVHREVCQDAAVYCNPGDVSDIKQKINFIFSLIDSSRKELVEQGKRQAKHYSWEKMAKETLGVYESCAGL